MRRTYAQRAMSQPPRVGGLLQSLRIILVAIVIVVVFIVVVEIASAVL